MIDSIANRYNLNQLIQEPTHIHNSSSSCIDLLFTSQPTIVMEFGIHSSLHSYCHHQIVFAKFTLSIFYPPPYERTIWYYEKANAEPIRRTIDQFDWLKVVAATFFLICFVYLKESIWETRETLSKLFWFSR